MKWLVFCLTVLLMVGGTAAPLRACQRSEHTPAYSDEEGYRVLSLALRTAADGWKLDEIHILRFTASSSEMHPRVCSNVPKDFDDAAVDLLRRAKKPRLLKPQLSLEHYTLVGPNSPPVGGSETPKTQEVTSMDIPRGTFEVAAVGFNARRTRAIVRVDFSCGSFCGGGNYYFYVKQAGSWKPADAVMTCPWNY